MSIAKRSVPLVVVAAMWILLCPVLLAQVTTQTTIPPGFVWWYILIFIVGVVLHFIVHVVKEAGWKALLKRFPAQFAAWFLNKLPSTFASGIATVVFGWASQLGLKVDYTTLNALGIVVALASGYIADSMFNKGGPAVQLRAPSIVASGLPA